MYIRIVTFKIHDATHQQYVEAAIESGFGIARWPGLLAAWWLGDPATNTYGGVCVFEDEESAARTLDSPEIAALRTDPHLLDVEIRDVATIEDLDLMTALDRRAFRPVAA